MSMQEGDCSLISHRGFFSFPVGTVLKKYYRWGLFFPNGADVVSHFTYRRDPYALRRVSGIFQQFFKHAKSGRLRTVVSHLMSRQHQPRATFASAFYERFDLWELLSIHLHAGQLCEITIQRI